MKNSHQILTQNSYPLSKSYTILAPRASANVAGDGEYYDNCKMEKLAMTKRSIVRAFAQKGVCFGAALAILGVSDSFAAARDQIKIVGSSTVYPFATVVAERLGSKGKLKTPVVESTGTGGGMKLFCGGVGEQYADIVNASRAMKASEW
ncbi:MAG: substrate-binding domain-containing protein [Bdellovibrionales bacterium]|nr:substrate-binding domain-containing protein [Bdellovibrionales bacterium]